MARVAALGGNIAEVQGLYGPFSFPEKLLQKIWLRGEFDRERAATMDGRRVQIVHPGKWNLLGGPDFKGARLRFESGPVVTGEVELHLDAADWAAHGHARDPAYDQVKLHVVLFPPAPDHVTMGADGRALPVMVLLPLLLHDLEEFAAEDAVETLANRPVSRLLAELGPMAAEELWRHLRAGAAGRWRQKLHFARLRVQRLGWEAACHHAALEILGYRFNRAPMLRIASAHPLDRWARGEAVPGDVFAVESGAWSLQGVRPANRPRHRLEQYADWVKARNDWPARLVEVSGNFPLLEPGEPSGPARRGAQLAALRETIAGSVVGDAVGGTRLDNLVCDGFLPLVATRTGRDLEGLWFHWYAGDLPPAFAQAVRALGLAGSREQPSSHGLGQGLLGWLLQREREAAESGRGA